MFSIRDARRSVKTLRHTAAMQESTVMDLIDLTLPTPEENLALDEALLNVAEATGAADVLRIWHPTTHCVVLGRGSKAAEEANRAFCTAAAIPLLRRTSGGASVVTGPGCLMYSLILETRGHAWAHSIDAVHARILDPLAAQLSRVHAPIRRAGISDLVVESIGNAEKPAWRKVSGNSLRRKRTHVLYHGTVLFDFDLRLIDRCLKTPPRMPDYRERRDHHEFVSNLDLSEFDLRQALCAAWPTEQAVFAWPRDETAALVAEKYTSTDWNFRH